MNDFTGISGGDDGDLQAVVRGCNNGFFSTTTTFMDNPSATSFASATIQQDDDDDEFVFSAAFPDSFETTSTVLDELEQLYKPFYYPMLKPLSPQSFLSSSSSSISVSGSEERDLEKVQEKEAFSGSNAASTALAVKYKRRKTPHKRVVLQVKAEDLSSDTWAWRKYGQKPIKGSPHPRSYYRCSSSKGCLARKQVERSQSDPDMFVVTYTAEHCHSQPTRRSSLAGTTRHKFTVPKSSTSTGGDSGGSPISSSALSPPQNLSLAAMEDEQTMKKKSTEEEEDEQRMISERSEHNDNGELMICDMILSDDFLLGFDELDRLMNSDLSYNGALLEQLPMIFAD